MAPRLGSQKWAAWPLSWAYSFVQVLRLCVFLQAHTLFKLMTDFVPFHCISIVIAGCFCNVGGCQEALGLSAADVEYNYSIGRVCSDTGHDIVNGTHTGRQALTPCLHTCVCHWLSLSLLFSICCVFVYI